MLGVGLIFILVMVLLLFQLRKNSRKPKASGMGSGMLGRSRVKVECTVCRQSFPAVADRLDLYQSGPQNYLNCPYCRRPTKVTILR
ncbi:MAG: hypothetical protein K5891_06605 [Lachnospiraceae bacterium]|nr:hypothetical protein [Lachnospiraceae bacterium]